jgi:hypothetical protein
MFIINQIGSEQKLIRVVEKNMNEIGNFPF